jgi:S1-C subfamily serine protease
MDEPDARPQQPDQQPEQHAEPAGQYPGQAAGDDASTHPHTNPARLGAPVPPPPDGPFPPTSYAAPPPAPRRNVPRLIALGTALAVIAVAGGLGFALGRSDSGGNAAGGPGSFSAPGNQGGQGFGQAPSDGGEGTTPFGGTPFSGPAGPDGQGGQDRSPFDSSSNGSPASTDQLTGLVRVAATLKYAGGKAAGTGMVLTSGGEVITNHHVVEGATGIRVKVMSTGTTYRAEVIGTDAKDDVAVLQLKNAAGLATVTPDTDGIGIGDDVTAVGDAGGSTSTFSAADGTVTGTGKDITTHSEGSHAGEKLTGLIEISSDVISGDSGGATYDDDGEVVGMTTAASSGPSDVVGYAIPIAKVLGIADDLEHGIENARYDYGTPAFLGLGLAGNDTQVGGVYPGTPAAEAGVTAGDTVTRVGSTRVRTATALRQAITAYAPGDQVQITWVDASGTPHVATVTLMAGPVA